jgi:hypothetical protein
MGRLILPLVDELTIGDRRPVWKNRGGRCSCNPDSYTLPGDGARQPDAIGQQGAGPLAEKPDGGGDPGQLSASILRL